MRDLSLVTVNGVGLNVVRMPQRGRRRHGGMPIVMIHGLAASSAFWYAAGAGYISLIGPVLLYDLRGHGKSGSPDSGYTVMNMAKDLGSLLDAEGIEVAHLIAHSFGGMIALAFALKSPDRVASLTLADVRVRPIQKKISIPAAKVPPALERQLSNLGLDINAISHSDDGISYLRTVARIQVEAGEDASELLAALYRHPRLFRSRRNAMRWIELTERASLVADLDGENAFAGDELRRLTMPMLVLVGEKSTTTQSAENLVRFCPHAHLRVVPDVGHFFPMSHPKLFLRPTLRFLQAVGRRSPQGELAEPRLSSL